MFASPPSDDALFFATPFIRDIRYARYFAPPYAYDMLRTLLLIYIRERR